MLWWMSSNILKVRIEHENIQSKLKGRFSKDKMRENRPKMVWSCKNETN